MLRKIIVGVLLFGLLVSFPVETHAFGINVDLSRTIPFGNCGVPGNDSAKACCYFYPIKVDKLPWIVNIILGGGLPSIIPSPGNLWEHARNAIHSFEDDIADVQPCLTGSPYPPGILPSNPSCTCEVYPDSAREPLLNLCTERFNPANRGGSKLSPQETTRLQNEMNTCIQCASDNGYYSAIGCIRFNLADFITKWVFGLGVSLAGLFALFCIIVAAIRIQLSRGNADTITKSREMMTSCILGLLLIIFSVFLMNLVGITILPGLFF